MLTLSLKLILMCAALFGLSLWFCVKPQTSQSMAEILGKIPQASTTLKIVTYNMGYASGQKNNQAISLTEDEVKNNLVQIATILKATQADVICLQEVDFDSARTFGINQLDFINTILGFQSKIPVITWNHHYVPWPYWPVQFHFGRMVSGQAILSRFPVTSVQNTLLEKPSSNNYFYNLFYLDRIIQKVVINNGGTPLSIFNVHLEAYDEPTRLSQAQKLSDLVTIEALENHVIVAGDFNSISFVKNDLSPAQKGELEDQGKTLKIFSETAKLINAEKENLYTFSSWDPYKKIDHIYYSPAQYELLTVESNSLQASDHLPVIATLRER